jgi:hypothetical protein
MPARPGKAVHRPTPDRRRRRYPRYRSSFPVVVTLFAGGEYQKREAHCKDLSEAGIGILLAAELISGEVVSLGFTLPGLPVLWDVRAVLRHRRGYQYGFEFLALPGERRVALKNYLNSLDRADQDDGT